MSLEKPSEPWEFFQKRLNHLKVLRQTAALNFKYNPSFEALEGYLELIQEYKTVLAARSYYDEDSWEFPTAENLANSPRS
jgi:hypothetical protein